MSTGVALLMVLASAPARAAQPLQGGATCFATLNDGAHVYSGTTAQAVRDAVDAATSGSIIKFTGYCPGVLAQGGTTQTVLITKSLSLVGGYTVTDWVQYNPVANPTTLDAQGGGRVVSATSTAASVTLQGFSVTNGYISTTAVAYGGGIFAAGVLTLADMVVYSNILSGNPATGAGGGGAYFEGPASVSNTTFNGNIADGASGGGAYFANPASRVTNTHFIGNVAGRFGGGALFYAAGPSVADSVFSSNSAAQGGGAYFLSDASVTGATFSDNISTGLDGGGAVFNGSSTYVTNTRFSNNFSSNRGGGAYFANAAWVTGTTFSGNTAHITGGGAYFNVGQVAATTFSGNIAHGVGGGAYFNDPVGMTNATFSDNAAASGGGAYFANAATLTNSTFINNQASNSGGGMLFGNAAATQLVNVLLARNWAGSQGAAVYVGTANALRIVHTTIVSPTAPTGAVQAVYVQTGTVYLTNTLVASHTVGFGVAGGTVREWHGLYAGVTMPYTGSVSVSGSLTGTAAFLNPALDDYRLTAASAALNGGTTPNPNWPFDIDGYSRPQDTGYDIGYDEYWLRFRRYLAFVSK